VVPTKAGIAGCITVCAEVNPKITQIRHSQGWINEVVEDINELVKSRAKPTKKRYLSVILEI
jgi:urocanate hydratase